MKVYLAGAITSAPQWLLDWYVALRHALKKYGIETYVPHEDEPDDDNPEKLFERDMEQIQQNCDAIVATLSRASTGMGMEIVLGGANRPLVALIHSEESLSPFVVGYMRSRGVAIYEIEDDVDPGPDRAAEIVARELGCFQATGVSV